MSARLLRLGFVADLLSRPVLVGYLAGVAVTMIAGQLGRVTGVPVAGRTFTAEVGSFARHLGAADLATLVLAGRRAGVPVPGGLALAHAPGPLLAILLATVVVAVVGATSPA